MWRWMSQRISWFHKCPFLAQINSPVKPLSENAISDCFKPDHESWIKHKFKQIIIILIIIHFVNYHTPFTQSVFGKFHLTLKIDVQIISQLISQSQTCSTIRIFKSSIIFICLICYFLILTDRELAEKQTKCLQKKKRHSTHEGRG